MKFNLIDAISDGCGFRAQRQSSVVPPPVVGDVVRSLLPTQTRYAMMSRKDAMQKFKLRS